MTVPDRIAITLESLRSRKSVPATDRRRWSPLGRAGSGCGLGRARNAATALEFAVVSLPFLTFLLGTLELSYDLFSQAALDAGLQVAVRQIETGNTQNALSGTDFVTNYLCPDLAGLLECGNRILISIQKVTLSSTNDFYAYTTGVVPVVGNQLVVPSSYGSFCNAAANQALVVSVIYIGPTFLGALLPGIFSVHYGSSMVHPTLSTKGVITEGFPAQTAPTGTTPAASC